MAHQQRELYDFQTEGGVPEHPVSNQAILRLSKEKLLESAIESSRRLQFDSSKLFGGEGINWSRHAAVHSPSPTVSADAYSGMNFRLPKTEFDARVMNRPIAVIQQWEGVVTGVGDDEFTARLHDITDPTNAAEEADFLIEDLNPYNLPLLKEGAVFRWIIGYKGGKTSTRSRVSQITFRRLPVWTEKELSQADQKAKDLVTEIDWD